MLSGIRPVANQPLQERRHFECPNCGNDLVEVAVSEPPSEDDAGPGTTDPDGSIPIGVLAKASGATVETIRYYERIGLLSAPPRNAGGRRVYDARHLRTLVFIRRARELDFSISEIAALLGLNRKNAVTCGEVQKIAVQHLEGVRAKLRDLQKLEGILASTVSRCSGEATAECPVLDILDMDRSELLVPISGGSDIVTNSDA